MLDKVNVGRVITSNDHIIHIEKKKSPTLGRSVNKQSRVVLAGLKTSSSNNSAEVLKPGLRSLFETVEGTTQPADQARRSSKTWGRNHVDLLLKISVKKGILHIQLKQRPTTDSSNSNKCPDRGHVCHRSKSLIIVPTMLLLKTPSYQTDRKSTRLNSSH